ncbi:response regulator [Candidatus Nephthysia bennettiae]|uniref:response regulator n=1 Tax=Candidatus Nephthysia bennettiae TaxID=3127016 RepID=UPI0030C76968
MRVLLVEDDHRLASSLRRNLGEAGIAADAVHDGEEGLEAAQLVPYDLILLDVMLPGLDGMEVSRRLRRARVHTPILMLTARDSVDDRVGGLESGADDYLSSRSRCGRWWRGSVRSPGDTSRSATAC